MAITYEVNQLRDDSGGFSKGSGEDTISIDTQQRFRVVVSDPANPSFNPADITVLEAIRAPGLPIVNQTTWTTPSNGLIIPYLTCSNKQGQRNPDKISEFTVTCEFATGQRADQGEPTPQAPPINLTDFAPKVEFVLGEDEVVRYSDKDSKDCLTPTGNYYDSPFVELVPTDIIRVTQYEGFISHATMRSRKFKLNDDNGYRGDPANQWMIMQVEAIEVDVELQSGTQNVAQVTYEIHRSSRPGLWLDQRALIDSHYFDTNNGLAKTPFWDDVLRSYVTNKVDEFGQPNTGNMLYDNWRMQDQLNFNLFLQA